MGDAVELLADRGVDRGDSMSVNVAPQRGMPVEISPSVGVRQMEAVGLNNDRRGLVAIR